MTLFTLQPSIEMALSDLKESDLKASDLKASDAKAPDAKALDVKSNAQLWMIIDGALIKDAEPTLVERFVKSDNKLVYRNLFAGTKWQDVAAVAPIVIHYQADMEAWAQSQRPWRFGLVFASQASLEELVEHWHQLIHCQQLGLEGSLCRLYDGIVLYHLLHQGDDNRQAKWLGPMDKIWLPDYVNQQYFYAERPILEDPMSLTATQFSDPEWQALADAKRYATAFRLTQHMDEHFPDYWQTIDNKQQHVIEQLKKLETLGPVTQQDATYYMNLLGRLGPIWQNNTLHTDAVALLENHNLPMAERLEQVNQLAQQ